MKKVIAFIGVKIVSLIIFGISAYTISIYIETKVRNISILVSLLISAFMFLWMKRKLKLKFESNLLKSTQNIGKLVFVIVVLVFAYVITNNLALTGIHVVNLNDERKVDVDQIEHMSLNDVSFNNHCYLQIDGEEYCFTIKGQSMRNRIASSIDSFIVYKGSLGFYYLEHNN